MNLFVVSVCMSWCGSLVTEWQELCEMCEIIPQVLIVYNIVCATRVEMDSLSLYRLKVNI